MLNIMPKNKNCGQTIMICMSNSLHSYSKQALKDYYIRVYLWMVAKHSVLYYTISILLEHIDHLPHFM